MKPCKLWTGATNAAGYGRVTHAGRTLLAHRVALAEHMMVPVCDLDGQVVRHTCDTPACVEPTHLLLGTHQDNMDDRAERGRAAKGEDNGRAKLTDEQCRIISAEYVKGSKDAGLPALARKYGLHRNTVRNIITGVRHVS